jgi:hypothetical protein
MNPGARKKMNSAFNKIWRTTFLLIIFTSAVFAGPPFNTDDPVPVDFLHWEFYMASSYQLGKNNDAATLPHFEVNYGAVPNVQIHLLAGMGYVKEDANHQYGFMTAELGFKYRFIDDEKDGFQAGIFPLIELPTTSKENLVGNQNLQTFLPVWIQKSWGKFTTYGGSGYWINPGENNKNSVFAGWQAQYDFTETLSLGGELYYESPDTKDGSYDTAFKVGGFINVNEENHILFSVGHSFKNTDVVSGYLGYQLTI